MGDEAPRYAIRGKIEGTPDKGAMAAYMAQLVAGVMGIAVQTGRPVVDGRPREDWQADWGRLCAEGKAEERVRELILQEDEEELRRTFGVALTVAANGLVAMHQMEFVTALGTVMANILATDGGAAEYARPQRPSTQ